MEVRDAISKYVGQPITKQLLLDVLKDYKRPYDKINEMVKTNQLVLLKRGVYITGKSINNTTASPFLLANHLLGPSYISLDTALSYWGIIPEKVFEITSVTTQKSKIFNTDIGRFSYTNLPLPYYAFDIERIELSKTAVVLMASVEKSLCDKIITTKGILLRSMKETTALLFENYRMDSNILKNMDTTKMENWLQNVPKNESIFWLIKTLKKL
jgi:predicted transcriptional regulator of viral defense system